MTNSIYSVSCISYSYHYDDLDTSTSYMSYEVNTVEKDYFVSKASVRSSWGQNLNLHNISNLLYYLRFLPLHSQVRASGNVSHFEFVGAMILIKDATQADIRMHALSWSTLRVTATTASNRRLRFQS